MRTDLQLPDDMIDTIKQRKWGRAGELGENYILATKIPKSGTLRKYLLSAHPEEQRKLYCHCPRICNAVVANESFSSLYCYCGGGFYQGIWEYILERPVTVSLEKSILKGDEICQFRIAFR